jgi:hypothetical protein
VEGRRSPWREGGEGRQGVEEEEEQSGSPWGGGPVPGLEVAATTAGVAKGGREWKRGLRERERELGEASGGVCRMDLPGLTTSVGTRTDYSVGPWDYPACVTRHLMA